MNDRCLKWLPSVSGGGGKEGTSPLLLLPVHQSIHSARSCLPFSARNVPSIRTAHSRTIPGQIPRKEGEYFMELRFLSTESERRIFGQRMVEARAQKGVGFAETKRSLPGKMHVAFSQLWGLFERDGGPPARMMSGFSMRDLASVPQTYPKPDMTYLPARSVLECGELWSFSKGAELLALRGAAIIAGLMRARAILVYPVSRPWDGTISYAENDFVKAC